MTNNKQSTSTRRKFLGGAAVAGVATIAMPQVSRAQTATLKMQGSWPAKDIFNEIAIDYVKQVNDMAGGRLKIDFLSAVQSCLPSRCSTPCITACSTAAMA